MNVHYLLCSAVVCLLLSGCKPAETQSPAVPPAEAVTKVAETSSEPKVAPCQLKLGFESWEPYQYVGLEQQASGLDIEIMQAVAGRMNCTLVLQHGTWQELLGQFRQGQLDVLLGASKTPAREQFALFSEPYRAEQFQLFVRKDDAGKFNFASVAEMVAAKHKVGLISDYYYGEQITALYSDEQMRPHFVESTMSEQNIAVLLDEQVDAVLEDSFVGAAIIRRKGLEQQIEPHSIKLEETPIYVMFSKSTVQPEQVSSFNQALQQLKDSGDYQQLLSKYQG
ncbi:amino acid ABC transporter substrate-binding protein [Rheinheimera mesophila]|uniref:Amino acid ABC transporter substrate-binding protein n=1 Tax=Rheinheimera mesophila TaxID=1547515 RepID=A0A3P3QRV7_9GAMM|nr:transporter substrate-binding domain-containing protein [Rheinheimera mesophila]KKL02428.1 amino acid ABC transporter substrate-binding protein [Rheinheimera mesophila]RRJ23249.1 amino acid ABC transporter substrate-binding protein [Rheinheimera mesophila]